MKLSLATLIAPWHLPAAAQPPPRLDALRDDEDVFIERTLLHEMMAQHPEAMQSELGLMSALCRCQRQS